MKVKIIKWFRHVMRRSSSKKAAVEWKQTGKRQRRHPRKRWVDGIRQDMTHKETRCNKG